MKTKFFGKGKLWLAVLIALCAVVSACAALACCLLQQPNESTTTIQAPEHGAKPQYSKNDYGYYYTIPTWSGVWGSNVVSSTGTTLRVKNIDSSSVSIDFSEDYFERGWASSDLPSGSWSYDDGCTLTITDVSKLTAGKTYTINIQMRANFDIDNIQGEI